MYTNGPASPAIANMLMLIDVTTWSIFWYHWPKNINLFLLFHLKISYDPSHTHKSAVFKAQGCFIRLVFEWSLYSLAECGLSYCS